MIPDIAEMRKAARLHAEQIASMFVLNITL